MTQDEIMEMARQAGFERLGHTDNDWVCYPEDIKVFANLVAAKERNALAQRTWVGLTDDDELDWEEGSSLKDLVKAIEAKLKQKNGFAEEKNI